MSYPKPVGKLDIGDIQAHSVWQFIDDESSEEMDETWVLPVADVPVNDLVGRFFATQVTLANGETVWALIDGIDPTDVFKTEVFIRLSLYQSGIRFILERNPDAYDYESAGPDALADFLGLNIEDVFPIAYDVSLYATGETACLSGQLSRAPKVQLSFEERMDLVFDRYNGERF